MRGKGGSKRGAAGGCFTIFSNPRQIKAYLFLSKTFSHIEVLVKNVSLPKIAVLS